jgi:carboxyl-terminal processing protease
VIPDITYPSLFDPEEIGESALDNALAWDQIAPARFNRYHDYGAIMPMLTSLHEKRAANDPDYLYLQDRVAIAQEARTITALPLQEAGRLAMRDDQESKALVIENKRRVAKGLEPLENLADAEQDEQGIDGDSETANSSPEGADETVTDPDPRDSEDVLLMETGRILVDAITLRPNTSVAGRTQ